MKIQWDKTGERLIESGVDHGVLFKQNANGAYQTGVAWNGLTAVNESPSGAEPNDLYADNIKYASLRSAEQFGATVEAYTYPDEFAECDGSAEIGAGVHVGGQTRRAFGLSYRTLLGNDTSGLDHGYKLHLVYGATANPSEKNYETVNEDPDAITFSWELTTTGVVVDGYKPISHITIDSTKADATKLKTLEDKLYGTDESEPTLPLPDEIITMFGATASEPSEPSEP